MRLYAIWMSTPFPVVVSLHHFCILYLIDIIYQEVDDESLADFFILDLITECSRLN